MPTLLVMLAGPLLLDCVDYCIWLWSSRIVHPLGSLFSFYFALVCHPTGRGSPVRGASSRFVWLLPAKQSSTQNLIGVRMRLRRRGEPCEVVALLLGDWSHATKSCSGRCRTTRAWCNSPALKAWNLEGNGYVFVTHVMTLRLVSHGQYLGTSLVQLSW